MTATLADRLRARAAALDTTGTRHQPTCHGGDPCHCGHQPGPLVRVVEAVLERHANVGGCCAHCVDGNDGEACEMPRPYPCETTLDVARALGVEVGNE